MNRVSFVSDFRLRGNDIVKVVFYSQILLIQLL